VSYRDRKERTKLVRYWLMQPEEDLTFVPNDEVDAMRWVGLGEARRLLTYPRDAEVLDSVEAEL
jgi:8-oxo-dGTP diphosphatase